MASVEERLKLKRGQVDPWSTREKLCLASSVVRSGNQNWMSVSRSLKVFGGEPGRPADWFSQKSCAVQYDNLLTQIETPKRKKRGADGTRTEGDLTPAQTIVKQLTVERIEELRRSMNECREVYLREKEKNYLVQNGLADDKLDEMIAQIQEEKKQKELEQEEHQRWLKVREERKHEMEMAWRPLANQQHFRGPRRPSNQSELGSDTDNVENPSSSDQPAGSEEPVETKPVSTPTSPLLTSLLKSPSPVTGPQSSSILHSAITSQRGASPTITSLLNSSPGVPSSNTSIPQSPNLKSLVSNTLAGHDDVPKAQSHSTSSSPTLSMLLELPPSTPGKLPELPYSATKQPVSASKSGVEMVVATVEHQTGFQITKSSMQDQLAADDTSALGASNLNQLNIQPIPSTEVDTIGECQELVHVDEMSRDHIPSEPRESAQKYSSEKEVFDQPSSGSIVILEAPEKSQLTLQCTSSEGISSSEPRESVQTCFLEKEALDQSPADNFVMLDAPEQGQPTAQTFFIEEASSSKTVDSVRNYPTEIETVLREDLNSSETIKPAEIYPPAADQNIVLEAPEQNEISVQTTSKNDFERHEQNAKSCSVDHGLEDLNDSDLEECAKNNLLEKEALDQHPLNNNLILKAPESSLLSSESKASSNFGSLEQDPGSGTVSSILEDLGCPNMRESAKEQALGLGEKCQPSTNTLLDLDNSSVLEQSVGVVEQALEVKKPSDKLSLDEKPVPLEEASETVVGCSQNIGNTVEYDYCLLLEQCHSAVVVDEGDGSISPTDVKFEIEPPWKEKEVEVENQLMSQEIVSEDDFSSQDQCKAPEEMSSQPSQVSAPPQNVKSVEGSKDPSSSELNNSSTLNEESQKGNLLQSVMQDTKSSILTTNLEVSGGKALDSHKKEPVPDISKMEIVLPAETESKAVEPKVNVDAADLQQISTDELEYVVDPSIDVVLQEFVPEGLVDEMAVYIVNSDDVETDVNTMLEAAESTAANVSEQVDTKLESDVNPLNPEAPSQEQQLEKDDSKPVPVVVTSSPVRQSPQRAIATPSSVTVSPRPGRPSKGNMVARKIVMEEEELPDKSAKITASEDKELAESESETLSREALENASVLFVQENGELVKLTESGQTSSIIDNIQVIQDSSSQSVVVVHHEDIKESEVDSHVSSQVGSEDIQDNSPDKGTTEIAGTEEQGSDLKPLGRLQRKSSERKEVSESNVSGNSESNPANDRDAPVEVTDNQDTVLTQAEEVTGTRYVAPQTEEGQKTEESRDERFSKRFDTARESFKRQKSLSPAKREKSPIVSESSNETSEEDVVKGIADNTSKVLDQQSAEKVISSDKAGSAASTAGDEDDSRNTDSEVPAAPIKVEKVSRADTPSTEDDNTRDVEPPQPVKRGRGRYARESTSYSDSVPSSPAHSQVNVEEEKEHRAWKKSIMLVYNRIATHKNASIFLRPITDDIAPNYSSMIHRRLDLQTIKKKIESGEIRTTDEFQRDILIMFNNAIMYNKTETPVHIMAREMQEECVAHLNEYKNTQMLVHTGSAEVGHLPSRRGTRTAEKKDQDSDGFGTRRGVGDRSNPSKAGAYTTALLGKRKRSLPEDKPTPKRRKEED